MAKKKKIPDRRAVEKMTSDLERLLERRGPGTRAEIEKYLGGIVKNGKIPDAPPRSAVQLAQNIMYEAWEEENGKKRINLAKEALEISPDCADAYNLLAEEEAETLEEALEYYKKGLDAGRRALGEDAFKEYEGHFWGYTKTRPYMRSHAGCMECLWGTGAREDALVQAREMLKLNPNDNQGIRYILAGYLAELGRHDELDELLNNSGYEDDCAADWLYTRALLSFVKHGDSEKANSDLRIALEGNRYVPEYLSRMKPVPGILPASIQMGGEDEGFCYAASNLKAWEKVKGAVDWLKKAAGIRVVPKASRNEPCPCGSGKKFKKCCGGKS